MHVLFASMSKKKKHRSAYAWRAVAVQVWNYFNTMVLDLQPDLFLSA